MNRRHEMQSDIAPRVITAQIVNGFVRDGPGGNPAAVVLDADHLGESEMQEIARKIGMSETAFISASDDADFRLDFFTPNRRIAHCGHATIAAFSHLAQLRRVAEGETSKMTVDGPRKVFIRGTQSFMEHLAPRYEDPRTWAASGVSLDDVPASVGLSDIDLIGGPVPQLVNTGNAFIIVPVGDTATLARIVPDQDAIEAISEMLGLIGYYLFALSADTDETDASTRMFAPRYAIPEEAATGMAAGPLACYLHDVVGIGKTHFEIAQGDYMIPPSPSRISVDLDCDPHGAIVGLVAGGFGRSMREVQIPLD